VPEQRSKALKGEPGYLLLEWSAHPKANRKDPEVWRAASPHWTPQRQTMMASQVGAQGFAQQWLNIWPDFAGSGEAGFGWPPGWAELPRVAGLPPAGLVAGVECSFDRRVFGLALSDGVNVWTRVEPNVEAALVRLRGWAPSRVVVGKTAELDFAGPWQTFGIGVKETREASPFLMSRLRGLAHDHDPEVAVQVALGKAANTEVGPVISARASSGPVPAVKAICWAVWAALDDRFQVAVPAIW
jgi:hypothetical protein